MVRPVESRQRSDERPSESMPPAEVEVEALPVEGFEPAVLNLGRERESVPVFVIAHGAGGRPEDHCDFWRDLLGPEPTLVCPRGAAMYRAHPERGYYFPDHMALEREVSALIDAVQSRVDNLSAAWTYVGYSQGAAMGALMIVGHAARFPRLVFIEGGGSGWSRSQADRFSQAGGERVLFVCGAESCRRSAERAVQVLEGASIAARLAYAVGGGHTYRGEVARELRRGLPWLLGVEAAP